MAVLLHLVGAELGDLARGRLQRSPDLALQVPLLEKALVQHLLNRLEAGLNFSAQTSSFRSKSLGVLVSRRASSQHMSSSLRLRWWRLRLHRRREASSSIGTDRHGLRHRRLQLGCHDDKAGA